MEAASESMLRATCSRREMWLTGCPSVKKTGGDGVAIDRGVYGDRGLDSDEALLGAGGAAVLCALPSR